MRAAGANRGAHVLYFFCMLIICWLIHVDSTWYLMILQVLTEIKFIHLDLARSPYCFPSSASTSCSCQCIASNLGTTTKSSGKIWHHNSLQRIKPAHQVENPPKTLKWKQFFPKKKRCCSEATGPLLTHFWWFMWSQAVLRCALHVERINRPGLVVLRGILFKSC